MYSSQMTSGWSRRQMLQLTGMGFGSIVLSALETNRLAESSESAPMNSQPRPGYGPAKAKSMIMLMQNGGPGQMDLFDPKPELAKYDGKVHVEKVEMFQPGSEFNKLLKGPFKFKNYGQCGMEMADVLPHIGGTADELCLVRSMHTLHNNHTESLLALNTGKIFPGRPSFGSWITYALGSPNQNLPGYVVLRDPSGYNTTGTLLWQNGWLPAMYRGTEISTAGTPVLNLNRAVPVVPEVLHDNLELLTRLNREHQKNYPQESELEARIQNYELAARMQLEAGTVLDIAGETPEMRKAYGLDNPKTARYGLRCLMARRMIEAGVRFVQVFPDLNKGNTQVWDSHTNVKTENEYCFGFADQPSAALIKDLKQRGLLDSTIVMWSGEFGRLPVSQNGTGRDHNRNAFSLLLAGGGFKAGTTHGATDEIGYRSVVDRVSVSDLHATLLHQLGLDHEKLAFTHHGRPETLTDSVVSKARVVKELLT